MKRSRLIVVVVLALLAGFAGTAAYYHSGHPHLDALPTAQVGGGSGQNDALPPARQVTSAPIEETTRIDTSGQLPAMPAGTAQPATIIEAHQVLVPTTPLATGKPRLAVVPFVQLGAIPQKDAGEVLAGMMLSEIDGERFDLVDRLRLVEILKEQKFQMTDLVDQGRAAKFGRLAAVRYLVVGELSRLGTRYILTARIEDCQEGIVQSHGGSVKFTSLDEADKAVVELITLLGLRGNHPQAALDNDLMNRVNPAAPFRVKIRPTEDKQVWYEGEDITFVVEADRDCFVTIVTRDSEGKYTLLLPSRWQRRQFVRKGEAVTIPAAGADFHFPVRPPYGETLVRVIATLEKPLVLKGIDEGKLQKDGLVDGGAKGFSVEPKPNIEGDVSIRDVLKPEEWATDEFTVITAKDAASIPTTMPAASSAETR